MKGNFQIIILIVFIVAAVLGVLVFSGAIPIGRGGAGSSGTVVLWGTMPSAAISSALKDFNDANPTFVVKYEQKSAETFDQDLLEALAEGTGPDMFFLPDNLAFHYANKILTIPYASYPLSAFKDIFAGAGEVFLTEKGVLAFPMSIDPLMLYYSRSMLDANGIVYPPATWTDLVNMVPSLTKKDDSNKIIKSAVAFGHFGNVVHAKDILAALFMQAGNPIIAEKEGSFQSLLDSPIGNYNLSSILKFYTDFADPNNFVYSWNKSFTNSDGVFSAENLAFYFGYASELQSLVNRNPNQNFFVAGVPQIKGSSFKLTAARVIGLAVSSSSENPNTAFAAANLMATSDFSSKFAAALGVAPARRDLLAKKPEDAYFPIFYSSALYAKSWLDPSPKDTDDIWSGMVGAVLSNNLSPAEAIKDASSKMSLLLLK
ncbi:MAG: Sugar ABC superfamily ATP binding cassette transporter substrate-binding protein [Candidatus Nomurabacteria bacterium GW2011_GWB1_43_7]|uniref:Sugar ABC superfamily ATP binding cassette transporter substrate-binding protein n=2 Tax=Candidatus Nomuraibacteriota TaxID=1752729 RepID=A0A0G1HIC0_9BACT|nr:MAG: Sugar ABC superfamily ATP binding cassette transporter substrate-binding protein [Candidatus Nomurabacteria bacterium GW2011_GWB1_43_7]